MAAKPDLVSLDALPLGYMDRLAEHFTVHAVAEDARRVERLTELAQEIGRAHV